MNPNDIAGQAQANWFRQANAQANNPPNPGTTSAPPVYQIPTRVPTRAVMPPSPPLSIGGLFASPAMDMPMGIGGLMDFNSLAMQLAGDPGLSMPSPGAPTINATQPDSMFQNFMLNPGQFLFPSRQGYGIRNPRANIGVRG